MPYSSGSSGRGLSTSSVAEIFAQEVKSAGGSVNNTFNDGGRVFLRAILPLVEEVRIGDGIKGGVALRADELQAWVHPYTFRLVCQNGAIRSHAIQTRSVIIGDVEDEFSTELELREAIRACSSPAVFMEGAEEMRSATEMQADLALDLLTFFTTHHRGVGRNNRVLEAIMQQFFDGGDRSRFGLMNAVTAVARETPEPELRWRLESLGGGIPVTAPTRGPAQARAALAVA